MFTEELPTWFQEAKKHLGRKPSCMSPKLKDINFWRHVELNSITNDKIFWAGAFVGAVLDFSNVSSSKSGVISSYMRWGFAIQRASIGCVTVLNIDHSLHIGFAAGLDEQGNLLILGANTPMSVTIKRYPIKNVIGYRWPNLAIKQLPLPHG